MLKLFRGEKRRKCWGCCDTEPKRARLTPYETGDYWCPVCIEYMRIYGDGDGISEGELRKHPHYENFKKEYIKYGKQQIL